MATRCGIKQKMIGDFFSSLEDEESQIVNTTKARSQNPTYQLMLVNNDRDLDELDFKTVYDGFFEMYTSLDLFIADSETLELANNIDYEIRAGAQKSPFKKRRIL